MNADLALDWSLCFHLLGSRANLKCDDGNNLMVVALPSLNVLCIACNNAYDTAQCLLLLACGHCLQCRTTSSRSFLQSVRIRVAVWKVNAVICHTCSKTLSGFGSCSETFYGTLVEPADAPSFCNISPPLCFTCSNASAIPLVRPATTI